MTSAGIIPSSWQLAQQINKKLHKPFTVQHTSIIRLQKTISISVIILIIDMVPLNKNLVFKYLVNVKVGLNILVLISLNIGIFFFLKKKKESNLIFQHISTSRNSSMKFLKNFTSSIAEGSKGSPRFIASLNSLFTILFHFLIKSGLRQSSIYRAIHKLFIRLESDTFHLA